MQPWSAELPRRYRVTVDLRDPSGAVVDSADVLVGFRHVEVTGRQWFWQFAYKRDGDVTSDSNDDKPLMLPAGKRIRLDLTAADVIHAWWIPALGPMIYVNPGERSYIFIDGVEQGDFKGQCNVFCGVRHAYMALHVKFVPEAEFEAWYKKEATP